MSTKFLAWRAPANRRWYPVGRLEDGGADAQGPRYRCTYTPGARQAQREAGFAPLASFPGFDLRYGSDALFALFANRLLPKSRPEYPSYLEWLSAREAPNDPLALLARSGGHRVTDEFELYPLPEPGAARHVRLYGFVHGVRYFAGAGDWLERLRVDDALLLQHDFQNAHDPNAVTVRTPGDGPGDAMLLELLPRYVAPEVHALRRALAADAAALRAAVERVNPPSTPLGLRLLCRVEAPWPPGYRPFDDEAHRPLAVDREVLVAAGPRPRRAAATLG